MATRKWVLEPWVPCLVDEGQHASKIADRYSLTLAPAIFRRNARRGGRGNSFQGLNTLKTLEPLDGVWVVVATPQSAMRAHPGLPAAAP